MRLIISLTNKLYIKPIRRIIPLETFRYGLMGGANLLLSMVLYWACFHFVLHKQDTDFGVVVISAKTLAFLISFVITFFTGFFLVRMVAFCESQVRGRRQLFRYAQVVAVNVAINYFGLELLVDVLGFYPSPSYAALQVVTVLFSYLAQRYYTFKTHIT